MEDVGTVHVDEQNACYEIFTPKLRIRVNKSPFNLQIFDKYQKLLFSDYADKGHISNGQRKLEYKTLRRDEHFFGLGEKTGKLDRRGEAYKMWNSDKPCYSAVEDPLYKSIPFFIAVIVMVFSWTIRIKPNLSLVRKAAITTVSRLLGER